MTDELFEMIEDLRDLVTDGPETVDMPKVIKEMYQWPWDSAPKTQFFRSVYAYADVELVVDWLPVGTPKDWVLGELDRLAEFVTGDDT